MSVPDLITVLVVDDDVRVLRAIMGTLALEDDLLVVDTAEDAPTALLAAALLSPVVALVDMLIPDRETGIDLVRSMSAAGCVVVAMSVRSSLREAALDAGAVAFVEKGGDVDAILAALRAAASRLSAE